MNIMLMIIYFSPIYTNAEVVNHFLVDYFAHKNVSDVVGFSCNDIIGDALLAKSLNENNIAITLNKLEDQSKINVLIHTINRKLGIFLDTRCYSSESITSVYFYAVDRRLYDEIRYWLVLGDNFTNVLSDINDDAFGMSTDFVVAVPSDNDGFKLYDLYNKYKRQGWALNVTFYGQWDSQNGLSVSLLQPKPARRSNFYGMSLKVFFYQSTYRPAGMSMHEWFEDRTDISRDTRIKFGYNIINYLAQLFNFSITYVESEPWSANDTLGPVCRAMMKFQVDLTGTATNMNSERASLMKFIHQGWAFRTCFFFRNPQPKTIKVGEIFRPFTTGVWNLMCFFIVLGMAALAFALKYDCPECDFIKIAYAYTMTIGAVCLQCTDIQMSRLSTRIVFLIIMIFSLVMYNYYSACVVSARLDEPIYKINDSLVELGKLHLKMASEQMHYLNFFLSAPNWEHRIFKRDYWLKIPESERILEPEVGMQLVKEGGFAYHAHPDLGYMQIAKSFDNREICEVTEVHVAKRGNAMFGVTNNCTFEEIIKIGFLKITETGLRNRQVNYWQYRKPRCRRDVLNASSVNMYEFATHLILLAIGMLLSLIIYLWEILVFYESFEWKKLKWKWRIKLRSRSVTKKFVLINNFL